MSSTAFHPESLKFRESVVIGENILIIKGLKINYIIQFVKKQQTRCVCETRMPPFEKHDPAI